ncbi:hypothetical protein MKS88_001723 [Plasmodium brasilianum]|uniref:Uncharacterized protein n=2 Tax=Plasmodium (Plasmodium) TaxID=418103 RepID=A0A1A8X1I5_PLAMA|nr:hypothetical protein MKS88_001723 [Plasmodium brasilianum]SBS98466.1 hypothetical protein PMALA_063620 [Plasmodium malariae]
MLENNDLDKLIHLLKEIEGKEESKNDVSKYGIKTIIMFRELNEILLSNDLKREHMLNDITHILSSNPETIKSKLKDLEECLSGDEEISESKLNEVKEILLGNELFSEDIAKKLKEYLLCSGPMKAAVLLKKLKEILSSDPQMIKLKLEVLENILLGNDATINDPNIKELRTLLMKVLSNYSKLKDNNQRTNINFLNRSNEATNNNLTKHKDTIKEIDENIMCRLEQNTDSENKNNEINKNHSLLQSFSCENESDMMNEMQIPKKKVHTINIYMKDNTNKDKLSNKKESVISIYLTKKKK